MNSGCIRSGIRKITKSLVPPGIGTEKSTLFEDSARYGERFGPAPTTPHLTVKSQDDLACTASYNPLTRRVQIA